MAKTFGEYLKSLGILGWLLMGLNLFTALGAFELYTEISVLQNFPTWGWIVLLGVGLIVMPFRAFHKVITQRDELQKQLDARQDRLAIKKLLDGFIGEGNHILAILTTESWEAIDKYDYQMGEWATRVRKVLREIDYENYFCSNPGMVKKENEDQEDPIKANLAIKRNYMDIRLQRLQQILMKLGD